MTKGPAGWVHSRVVANVQAATLNAFVRETVSHKVSLLCTDQYPGYNPLDNDYPHATVDHARGQYVIGAIHTRKPLKASGLSSSAAWSVRSTK